MAGVRLVPKRLVVAHEKSLRSAVDAAWAEQFLRIQTTLRGHGINLSLTAAGAAAAVGHISIPGLWSQDAWEHSVGTHLQPVASDVAKASLQAATTSVRIPSLWGQADTTDVTIKAITDKALGIGAWIGKRLDAAATKGPAPKPHAIVAAIKPKQPAGTVAVEDAGDVMEVDLTQVLATAGDILGDIISAMANTAATTGSQDVTNYLAQYVTSMEADPYLSASKSWNNAGDDRVREAHQDVDDVAINESFDVGGEPMIGPGDPQASDENTANCRCYVTYDGVVPEGSGYEDGQAPQYQGEASEGAPDEPDMEGENA